MKKIDDSGKSSAEEKGATVQMHGCARMSQEPKKNTLDVADFVRDGP